MRFVFFFQAEDGIRDGHVTGVQTCALPISGSSVARPAERAGAPRPLAHLLGELEPRNGFLIDLCRRLVEEGSGWVLPVMLEVERAQVLETLALVVVVEPEIRGPHVDPDPVGPPLVHRSCPYPMDQRGADALAGAVPADDEPGHVRGRFCQLGRRPQHVVAVLTAGDRAYQHALPVFHHPGQAVPDALRYPGVSLVS